jgi:hypothetical protein
MLGIIHNKNSMRTSELRKLQYMGNQYFLNIPRGFIKNSDWQKGDYFEVERISDNSLEIKHILNQPLGTDPQQRSNIITRLFKKFKK